MIAPGDGGQPLPTHHDDDKCANPPVCSSWVIVRIIKQTVLNFVMTLYSSKCPVGQHWR